MKARPVRSFHSSPASLSAPQSASSPTPSSTTTAPASSLPEQLRSVMRLLTHPVVVCTALDTPTSTPRGMTMSSFTSLSLSPTPLVTFNVATPSRTLDAIRSDPGREFNIHVLAAGGIGATVAENFTRGNAEGVFERLEGARCTMNGGAPLLQGEGVLYVLRCKVAGDGTPDGRIIQVRDHVIIVGEVLDVIVGQGTEGEGKLAALSYTDRSYRGVGGVIARH